MSQFGYGKSDAVGAPFDFYAGANVVTGSTITMLTAGLVLAAGATVAALTVNLPLNPPDGCCAEISSTNIITSLTVQANTGDTIVPGLLGAITATTFTPVASTGAGGATATLRYKYSLNGSQAGNAAAIDARVWVRVQ